MVSFIGQYKSLKMNQKDFDNILDIHLDSQKYPDRVLFVSVVLQALLDATKPKNNVLKFFPSVVGA